MSLLDQVNKVAEVLAQKEVREYLLSSINESRFLREIKKQRIAISRGEMEFVSLPTMEGPPFPEFHTVEIRQKVWFHRFTGEISRR